MIGTGAMCDPYMHCEMELGLTRRCLEIIDEYGFGLAIQTKSDRILRDLDLLKSINRKAKCVVQITMTTFDEALCKIVEPHVATTARRFEVLEILRENGIPTVVWMTPFLPFINDTRENIEGILDYCIRAKVYGIICFEVGLTLRQGNREYFYEALDQHFPGMKGRYHRKYGYAYEVTSDHNEELMHIIREKCREKGIESDASKVFSYLHEFPENRGFEQMSLFDAL